MLWNENTTPCCQESVNLHEQLCLEIFNHTGLSTPQKKQNKTINNKQTKTQNKTKQPRKVFLCHTKVDVQQLWICFFYLYLPRHIRKPCMCKSSMVVGSVWFSFAVVFSDICRWAWRKHFYVPFLLELHPDATFHLKVLCAQHLTYCWTDQAQSWKAIFGQQFLQELCPLVSFCMIQLVWIILKSSVSRLFFMSSWHAVFYGHSLINI